jgi:hypothetical protein
MSLFSFLIFLFHFHLFHFSLSAWEPVERLHSTRLALSEMRLMLQIL